VKESADEVLGAAMSHPVIEARAKGARIRTKNCPHRRHSLIAMRPQRKIISNALFVHLFLNGELDASGLASIELV
jgi:hypothetical protein